MEQPAASITTGSFDISNRSAIFPATSTIVTMASDGSTVQSYDDQTYSLIDSYTVNDTVNMVLSVPMVVNMI